jgi:hypothetical protein
MKPIVQAVRAIGAEFVRRALWPIIVVGVGVALVLLALGIWLVTVSAWWWLFLVPVVMLAAIFVILVVVVRIAVGLADSAASKEQKRAVGSYVDTLQRVAENLQTPQLIILYRVVRDVITPRPDGFIATMSQDSRTLAPDFRRLVGLFR